MRIPNSRTEADPILQLRARGRERRYVRELQDQDTLDIADVLRNHEGSYYVGSPRHRGTHPSRRNSGMQFN